MPKQLTETFERIRQTQGEDAYNEARISFIRKQASLPGSEFVLPQWFPDMDVNSIIGEAASFDLQSLMPSVQTKTHQDIALMCFEALKTVLDGCFSGKLVEANLARTTLEQALELAFKVHLVQDQVEQIPEDQRSREAQRFVAPAGQDSSVTEKLLRELEKVESQEGLRKWYEATKERRNQVEDQAQRNRLFDAIRAKNRSL
jgi:hypothetical protein